VDKTILYISHLYRVPGMFVFVYAGEHETPISFE
jgi:hypothetical protein